MITAYTLIKTETGRERDVFNAVRDLRGVKDISIVYGDYDIILKLELESTVVLSKYIVETIRKIPGVEATTTYMAAPM